MKTLAWSMIVTESYLYIFLFFKWIIQWLKILQMCHWFNQWLEITFTRNESKYGKSSKPWLNIYNPQKYFLKIWTIRLSSWRFWFNKRWKSNFLKRFFFFFNLLFNNGKIALQHCGGFCRATTQISHDDIYVSCLLSLPPIPPSHSSRSSESATLGS